MKNRTRLKNLLGASILMGALLSVFMTFDGPAIVSQWQGVNPAEATTLDDLEAHNQSL